MPTNETLPQVRQHISGGDSCPRCGRQTTSPDVCGGCVYIAENPAFAAFTVLQSRRDEAVAKAIDALGRHKFEMFGYWASAAVRYAQTLAEISPQRRTTWGADGSPFRQLVRVARYLRDGNGDALAVDLDAFEKHVLGVREADV